MKSLQETSDRKSLNILQIGVFRKCLRQRNQRGWLADKGLLGIPARESDCGCNRPCHIADTRPRSAAIPRTRKKDHIMSIKPAAHDLYNVEEAAIVLHASPLTIREWIKSGELKASLVGRQYLITRSAIDDFIECRAGIRKEPNVNPIVYEKRGNGRVVRVA